MANVRKEDGPVEEDPNNRDDQPSQNTARVNSEEADVRLLEDPPPPSTNHNPESVTTSEYLLQLLLYSPIKFYDKVHFSWGNIVWCLINIAKIILVTFYTKNVGDKRAAFGLVVDQGIISLRHLFLYDWSASWETVPYPPAHGRFAVYSVKDLAKGINHAVEQYYNAESNATGYFMRWSSNDSIYLRVKYFNISFGTTKDLVLGEVTFPPDHGLTNTTEKNTTVFTYDIEKEISELGDVSFKLKNVLSVIIQMTLYSIRVFEDEKAECLDIHATIMFNNTNNNGQVLVQMSTKTQWIGCRTINNFTVNEVEHKPPCLTLAAFSLCFLFVSIFIEISAIIVWIRVYCTYNDRVLDKKSLHTDTVFGAISSMLTFVGDMLSFVSILFIQLEYNYNQKLHNLDASVVPLGIGLVLIYVTFLRFVKFSQSSSLLFKTVQKAFIPVANFLVCVVILFIGFWMFAYIVFGLYHVKFTSPTSAADTLFSIINGDEIYATLANFDSQYAGNPTLIDVSLHLCVYIYVMVFTVIVFNLLIALFNSAYEVIVKKEHNKGGSLVNLQKCLMDARERQQTVQHLLEHLLSVTSRTEIDQQTDDLLKSFLELVQEKPAGQQSVEDLMQKLEKSLYEVAGPMRLAELIKKKERERCMGECGCCPWSFSC